jgi:hypothetical protein
MAGPSKSILQVVYLNQGTLSASSLSNAFCSSVNSCVLTSSAILSLLAFSNRHHVDIKNVRKKAILAHVSTPSLLTPSTV